MILTFINNYCADFVIASILVIKDAPNDITTVYFFTLLGYNDKFVINMLHEHENPDYYKVVSATQLQNTASSTKTCDIAAPSPKNILIHSMIFC